MPTLTHPLATATATATARLPCAKARYPGWVTRIIAGVAGSLRLEVPKSGTRPTTDRVREAIFSTLGSWGLDNGSRVLDLYAGSGALALEAMSRGAARALLVESDRAAAAVARSNAQALGWSSVVEVRSESVEKALLGGTAYPVDLVFLDPPYRQHLAERLLPLLEPAGLLNPGAVVIVEEHALAELPEQNGALTLTDRRRYGETGLWIFRHQPAGN